MFRWYMPKPIPEMIPMCLICQIIPRLTLHCSYPCRYNDNKVELTYDRFRQVIQEDDSNVF